MPLYEHRTSKQRVRAIRGGATDNRLAKSQDWAHVDTTPTPPTADTDNPPGEVRTASGTATIKIGGTST